MMFMRDNRVMMSLSNTLYNFLGFTNVTSGEIRC
jgi:hypothetical protein